MDSHAFSVASTDALRNDLEREAIADYLGRLSKAFAWADKHPDQWAQAVADQYQIPVDIAATLSKNFGSLLAPIDDATVTTTQVQADTFHDLKELPSEVNVSGMFDDSFADVLNKLNAGGES
jgi:sulfonate transport system substrate-binding protein